MLFAVFQHFGTACPIFRCKAVEDCTFDNHHYTCWPLVPKIAGSIPAEAVGFLG
jgi:hypothetical protein